MIQYKLIKEYPGHNLGETHCSDKSTKWYGTNFYDAYPDFWQKVEEVDYEITEVKYATEIRFLDNGYYRILKDGVGFELDYILKNRGTIHSVKRLSDGKVFTIGDETTKGTIHNFEIILNILSVSVGDQKTLLRTFDKLPTKTPLFTTKDGVKMFIGDSYCKVNNYSDYSIVIGFVAEGNQDGYKGLKFSTKSKAEEYILLNKPCLSLMDLLRIRQDAGWTKPFPLFEKIEELAKSKL